MPQGLLENSILTLLAIQRSLSVVLSLPILLVKGLAPLTPNLSTINNISPIVLPVSTPNSLPNSLPIRTPILTMIETASLTLVEQTAIKLAK